MFKRLRSQIAGTFCAMICGLHLPSLCLISKYIFEAFASQSYDDYMIHRLCMAMVMFCCCGFGVTLFQFLSVCLLLINRRETVKLNKH